MPSTGTIPAYLPTGKENALYNLYTYIKTQFAAITGNTLPAPTIFDLAYEQTLTYPCITMEDLGLGRLAEQATGRRLGPLQYGSREQTLVEFEIMDMNSAGNGSSPDYTSAEQNVRRMRDQLKFCLENAGMIDQIVTAPTPVYILPTIPLLDPNNGNAATGSYVWHPRGEANAWNETFIKITPDQPNLKKYRVTAKIFWERYEEANL